MPNLSRLRSTYNDEQILQIFKNNAQKKGLKTDFDGLYASGKTLEDLNSLYESESNSIKPTPTSTTKDPVINIPTQEIPTQNPSNSEIITQKPIEKEKTNYWNKDDTEKDDINVKIESVAKDHNIKPNYMKALGFGESNGKVNAKSTTGARGIMQVMPSTGKNLFSKNGLGQYNPDNTDDQLKASALLISDLMTEFKGDLNKVTAAYNTGESVIKEASELAASTNRKWIDVIPETNAFKKLLTERLIPNGIDESQKLEEINGLISRTKTKYKELSTLDPSSQTSSDLDVSTGNALSPEDIVNKKQSSSDVEAFKASLLKKRTQQVEVKPEEESKGSRFQGFKSLVTRLVDNVANITASQGLTPNYETTAIGPGRPFISPNALKRDLRKIEINKNFPKATIQEKRKYFENTDESIRIANSIKGVIPKEWREDLNRAQWDKSTTDKVARIYNGAFDQIGQFITMGVATAATGGFGAIKSMMDSEAGNYLAESDVIVKDLNEGLKKNYSEKEENKILDLRKEFEDNAMTYGVFSGIIEYSSNIVGGSGKLVKMASGNFKKEAQKEAIKKSIPMIARVLGPKGVGFAKYLLEAGSEGAEEFTQTGLSGLMRQYSIEKIRDRYDDPKFLKDWKPESSVQAGIEATGVSLLTGGLMAGGSRLGNQKAEEQTQQSAVLNPKKEEALAQDAAKATEIEAGAFKIEPKEESKQDLTITKTEVGKPVPTGYEVMGEKFSEGGKSFFSIRPTEELLKANDTPLYIERLKEKASALNGEILDGNDKDGTLKTGLDSIEAEIAQLEGKTTDAAPNLQDPLSPTQVEAGNVGDQLENTPDAIQSLEDLDLNENEATKAKGLIQKIMPYVQKGLGFDIQITTDRREHNRFSLDDIVKELESDPDFEGFTKEQIKKAAAKAAVHPVSKLPSVPHLNSYLNELTAKGKKFIAISGDFNAFKRLNDHFSHNGGNLIIQGVQNYMHQMSESFGAKHFHIGGDEFITLFEVDNDESYNKANKYLQDLAKYRDEANILGDNGEVVPLGISFGVSDKGIDDANGLLKSKTPNSVIFSNEIKQKFGYKDILGVNVNPIYDENNIAVGRTGKKKVEGENAATQGIPSDQAIPEGSGTEQAVEQNRPIEPISEQTSKPETTNQTVNASNQEQVTSPTTVGTTIQEEPSTKKGAPNEERSQSGGENITKTSSQTNQSSEKNSDEKRLLEGNSPTETAGNPQITVVREEVSKGEVINTSKTKTSWKASIKKDVKRKDLMNKFFGSTSTKANKKDNDRKQILFKLFNDNLKAGSKTTIKNEALNVFKQDGLVDYFLEKYAQNHLNYNVDELYKRNYNEGLRADAQAVYDALNESKPENKSTKKYNAKEVGVTVRDNDSPLVKKLKETIKNAQSRLDELTTEKKGYSKESDEITKKTEPVDGVIELEKKNEELQKAVDALEIELNNAKSDVKETKTLNKELYNLKVKISQNNFELKNSRKRQEVLESRAKLAESEAKSLSSKVTSLQRQLEGILLAERAREAEKNLPAPIDRKVSNENKLVLNRNSEKQSESTGFTIDNEDGRTPQVSKEERTKVDEAASIEFSGTGKKTDQILSEKTYAEGSNESKADGKARQVVAENAKEINPDNEGMLSAQSYGPDKTEYSDNHYKEMQRLEKELYENQYQYELALLKQDSKLAKNYERAAKTTKNAMLINTFGLPRDIDYDINFATWFRAARAGKPAYIENVMETLGVSREELDGIFKRDHIAYIEQRGQGSNNESVIRDIAERMSKLTGIKYEFINDKDQKLKGFLLKGKAYINLAHATNDTPIHEILAHPVLLSLRGSELYSNLSKELESGKGLETLNKVKESYSDKSLEDQKEEAIVELLGLKIKDKIEPTSNLFKLLDKLWNQIKFMAKRAFSNDKLFVKSLDSNTTLSDLANKIVSSGSIELKEPNRFLTRNTANSFVKSIKTVYNVTDDALALGKRKAMDALGPRTWIKLVGKHDVMTESSKLKIQSIIKQTTPEERTALVFYKQGIGVGLTYQELVDDIKLTLQAREKRNIKRDPVINQLNTALSLLEANKGNDAWINKMNRIIDQTNEHDKLNYQLITDNFEKLSGEQQEHYVTQIWGKSPDKGKNSIESFNQMMKEATENKNLKKKSFDTYLDGIKAGYTPKYSDITQIMTVNSDYAIQINFNKEFLSFLNGNNPMKAQFLIKDTPTARELGYRPISKLGIDIKELEGMAYLKDIKPALLSAFQDRFDGKWGTFLNTWSSVGSVFKKLQMLGGGFMALNQTEPYTGLLNLNPKKMKKNLKALEVLYRVDKMADAIKSGSYRKYLEDWPTVSEFIEHGGKLGTILDFNTDFVSDAFKNAIDRVETIKGGSLLSAPLKALKTGNEMYDNFIWDYLQNGFKLEGFRLEYERNLEKKTNKLGRELTKDEIFDIKAESAKYINDVYGGQNWKALMVSPRGLQIARAAFLSPDFFYSTTMQAAGLLGFGSFSGDMSGRVRRMKSAGAFTSKAALVYLTGLELTNMIFRQSDDEDEWEKRLERMRESMGKDFNESEYIKENPKPKFEFTPKRIKELSTAGNSIGRKFNIFVGRDHLGKEKYRSFGKMFMDTPELLFLTKSVTGDFFNPYLASLEKIAGKANPLLAGVVTSITGSSPSGFENANIKAERDRTATMAMTSTLIEFAKGLATPFMARTAIDAMQGKKQYSFGDIFTSQRSGVSKFEINEAITYSYAKLLDGRIAKKGNLEDFKVEELKKFYDRMKVISESAHRNKIDMTPIYSKIITDILNKTEESLKPFEIEKMVIEGKEPTDAVDLKNYAKRSKEIARMTEFKDNLKELDEYLKAKGEGTYIKGMVKHGFDEEELESELNPSSMFDEPQEEGDEDGME